MEASIMDHQRAIETEAAVRYRLELMLEDERDAYENHYFCCPQCAEEVKFVYDATDSMGQLAAETLGKGAPKPGWLAGLVAALRQPAVAFAYALLVLAAGFTLYQRNIITALQEPMPELRYVLTGIAHGAGDVKLINATKNSTLSLSVEYKPDGEFVSYQAQILAASGKVKYVVPLPANQTGDKATIAIHAGALDAGRYSMVVQGRTSDGAMKELGKGAFELQFTD